MKTSELPNHLKTKPAEEGPKHRILIVDDHPLFRHGIALLVNGESDLELCGEASAAPEALAEIRRLNPDLVILDISLKGTNGIELMKSIKVEFPKLPVLVLSMHDEMLYAARAMRAGARGYVMKQEALEKVMEAVHEVLRGEIYLSPGMAKRMIHEHIQGPVDGGKSPVERLSDREMEVLQLIGQGRGVREIAQELNLSVKTVESHREHIKQKFTFSSAREVTHFAVQWVSQQQAL